MISKEEMAALMAEPTSSVVEAAAPLGDKPMFAFYHYEYGAPTGLSFARGDQLHEWIRDLRAGGRDVRLGWELRGDPAPEGYSAEGPQGEECETRAQNCAAHGGRPGVTPEYPEPGSAIPGQSGYVVGTCGHRVAVSEWRASFRTCERCNFGGPPEGGDDRG